LDDDKIFMQIKALAKDKNKSYYAFKNSNKACLEGAWILACRHA
jgi:hypothetical protein